MRLPALGAMLLVLPLAAQIFDAEIAAKAAGLEARLVACRRDLHRHPELSNQEVRTSKVIAERLRALGLEVRTGVAGYGVVGLLKGAKPGPVIAYRADMDALPIQERVASDHASETPGVMHACGHDVHMTVALGVAEVLSGMKDRLPGTVKFLFQPAEEGTQDGGVAGAELMAREGVLDHPKVEAIFGLHTRPELEAGTMGYRVGAALASQDPVYVTIRGRMAHGSTPQNGIDAILVAAECVTALQSIRSRRIDTLEPLVLSLGTIHGGNRENILAEEVKLEGTLRTHNREVRARALGLIRQILEGVCATHGAVLDLRFGRGYPPTVNDAGLMEAALPSLRRTLGPTNLVAMTPLMGAEDFSFFAERVPGCFVFLGTGNKAKGITSGWHTATFDVDESAMAFGVKAMATVLVDALSRGK